MRGTALLLLIGAACVVPPDQTAGSTTPPPPGYAQPAPAPAGALTCPQIFQCAGPCTDDACTRACWDQGGAGDRERATAVSACAQQCGTDQACVQQRCATEIQMCNAIPATTPPTPAPPPVAGLELPAGVAQPSVVGKWGTATSHYNQYAQAGAQGAVRIQYDLRPDGTYTHRTETFQMDQSQIIDVREQGTWTLAGDQLTITPASTSGILYDRATRRPKQTFAVPLEVMTYRMQTHYFSGTDETNLVLTPAQPTTRDGTPSTHPLFPGAYLLSAKYKPEWMIP